MNLKEKKCDEMKRKIAAVLAVLSLWCGAGNIGEVASAQPEEKITINLASRILTFWRDGKKVTMYPIAVGAPESQTPIGSFSVLDMEENPEWIDPKDTKKKVPSGEENPLGYRWIRFYQTYGIHGTNKPWSIGEYVSNGCIRLKEENVEELYELTDIGTPVEIDYERIVIEQTPDGRVAYYIYPDGYGRQYLDVQTVKRALAEFGVAGFVSDAEIADKIEDSDGEPTFLPCTYRVEINDLWISGRAVKTEDGLYLPIKPVSALMKRPVTSDWDAQMLSTDLGAAAGKYWGGQWYVGLDGLQPLFGLSGTLGKDNVLRLKNVAPPPAVKESAVNTPERHQGLTEKADANSGRKK